MSKKNALADLSHYLKDVEKTYSLGNATEHSYRPAIKTLLESIAPGCTATNEPKRVACGAPDFVVSRKSLVVGYLEAKEIGTQLDDVAASEQLVRYLASLDNLLLTNHLEFRWYVGGVQRSKVALGHSDNRGRLNLAVTRAADAQQLLENFLTHKLAPIVSAQGLAVRLAHLAHIIRDTIVQTYQAGQQSALLDGWRQAFARVLIAGIDQPRETPQFADMIAQTLAYGLFSARIMDDSPGDFSRQEAQRLIPKSNPFLRDFFYQISGPALDDEPFAPYVDDLVTVLATTDTASVLRDFGRSSGQQDPVVHFYETFLLSYDSRLRELRGVYYTPQPVVSYLVSSVDYLLSAGLGCPDGLADNRKIKIPNPVTTSPGKGGKKPPSTIDCHRVLVLDPACGTGTFLFEVIRKIRARFMVAGNAGLWQGYVPAHLLPRLFGFELLMAPYAVAHFKIGLELLGRDLPESEQQKWAYSDLGAERLGIYLTNSLQEPHELTGLPLFTQFLSVETNAANYIKQFLPIMVVLGNPPYSNFGQQNTNEWISGLLDDYKAGLNERKLNLDDDYIKFIRFGQWRVQQTGKGILAFITNNSFLTGITHRRMRESLLDTFTDIYVLNLHGDSIKGERSPDGTVDENVFDIKQGVAATVFVKDPSGTLPGRVWYHDLWGKRERKYEFLNANDVQTIPWVELGNIQSSSCLGKFYFFAPTSEEGIDEYCEGIGLEEIFVQKASGIQTKRDALLVDCSADTLAQRMSEVLTNGATPEMRAKYPLHVTAGWGPDRMNGAKFESGAIRPYLYRPFDRRFVYYNTRLLGRAREEVSQHMLQENLALVFLRQTVDDAFRHALVVNGLCDMNLLISHHVSDRVAPLYLYVDNAGNLEKVPNLSEKAIEFISQRLGRKFVPGPVGDAGTEWCPEDLLYYCYAVLYAPKFRSKYDKFLKIAYPRIPIPSDPLLFDRLRGLGQRIADAHLSNSGPGERPSFPVVGNNKISTIVAEPLSDAPEYVKIWINETQAFDRVRRSAWSFKIGGYSVLERWLKERQGRVLGYDELVHFQDTTAVILHTIATMREVDDLFELLK